MDTLQVVVESKVNDSLMVREVHGDFWKEKLLRLCSSEKEIDDLCELLEQYRRDCE